MRRVVDTNKLPGHLSYRIVGDKGALVFLLLRVPQSLAKDEDAAFNPYVQLDTGLWMAADLGYHATTFEKGDEWHTNTKSCWAVDNRECWYDGSGLGAVEVGELWRLSGYDMGFLWNLLEEGYAETFDARAEVEAFRLSPDARWSERNSSSS